MATPDDFHQLVRPVVWRTGDTEYPYWGRGSLFILAYRSRSFLVTAKHVLNSGNPKDLCIFPRDDNRTSLPLSKLYLPTSTDRFDTDHQDISIVEIDESKIKQENIQNVHALKFESSYRSSAAIPIGAELMALGIPDFEVDYQKETIRFMRFHCLGTNKGPAPYKGCYEMSLKPNQENVLKSEDNRTVKLISIDGFSGCPVFMNVSNKPATFSPRIVGVALRGTVESGKLFFVGSDLLKEMLDMVASD